MTAKPPPVPRRFRFTREQYREITARGFFDNVFVELVFGLVYEMNPDDERHSIGRKKVLDRLGHAFDGIGLVGRVSPIDLPDSDPRPDVSVVAGASGPALLVVEIAGDSFMHDATTKAELYATAGVPEYWVLDITDRVLVVLQHPESQPTGLGEAAYRTRLTFRAADTVSPLGAPHASILVSDLLP